MDPLKTEAEKQVWAHCNLNPHYLPSCEHAQKLPGGVKVWGWVQCRQWRGKTQQQQQNAG